MRHYQQTNKRRCENCNDLLPKRGYKRRDIGVLDIKDYIYFCSKECEEQWDIELEEDEELEPYDDSPYDWTEGGSPIYYEDL